MRLYQQEIFGPVVTIMPFDDDQVVDMANHATYGLAATAWISDVGWCSPPREATEYRNCHPELPDGLGPRLAVRWIQAVRKGLRARRGGHRGDI